MVDKIGPWLYNRGVLDAQAKLSASVDAMVEELTLLERSSPLDR